MNEIKNLLQSKTVWSNIIGIASLLSPSAAKILLGVDPGAIAEAVSNGIAFVAFLTSTWSRIVATKRLV